MHLNSNRFKLIESLQNFFSVYDNCLLLEEKNTIENNEDQNVLSCLINSINKEWKEIKDYVTLLDDYVFWQSRKIYLNNMENFVAGKLNGSEFVNNVYYTLLSDKKEATILETNYKKQETLELNPKIFQFSKVIKEFEDVLYGFSEELDEDELSLNEDELKTIIKDNLPKVQKYFGN